MLIFYHSAKGYVLRGQAHFATVEKETASRDEIVKTLGVAGAQLRSEMGEPKASMQQFNQPLDEATSSSLEALQAVTEAVRQKSQHGDAAAAFSYLKRAIELDPKFAQAYAALGIGYFNVNQLDLSAENLKKAFELKERADQKGRFNIEAAYYNLTTGEVDKSIRTYTQWAVTYPQDPIAHGNLSAAFQSIGQCEKAVDEARKSLRLWQTGFAYVNLMTSDLSLNRLQEAKDTFDEARTAKMDDPELYVQRYLLAFLQGDRLAMEQQLAAAKGKPALENKLLCAQFRTETFYGRVRNARQFSQRAVDSASRAKRVESAAQCNVDHALVEAEIGNHSPGAERSQRRAGAQRGPTQRPRRRWRWPVRGELAQPQALGRQAQITTTRRTR